LKISKKTYLNLNNKNDIFSWINYKKQNNK